LYFIILYIFIVYISYIYILLLLLIVRYIIIVVDIYKRGVSEASKKEVNLKVNLKRAASEPKRV